MSSASQKIRNLLITIQAINFVFYIFINPECSCCVPDSTRADHVIEEWYAKGIAWMITRMLVQDMGSGFFIHEQLPCILYMHGKWFLVRPDI